MDLVFEPVGALKRKSGRTQGAPLRLLIEKNPQAGCFIGAPGEIAAAHPCALSLEDSGSSTKPMDKMCNPAHFIELLIFTA